VVRVVLLAAGAWLTGDMQRHALAAAAAATLKLGLLVLLRAPHHGLGRPWFDRAAFAGSSATARRSASPPRSTACAASPTSGWRRRSSACTASPPSRSPPSSARVVNLFRNSVLEAFLPSMSRMHAAGERGGMMDMNAAPTCWSPGCSTRCSAFVFVYARTSSPWSTPPAYVDAAPVMRVYALGMAMLAVEVGSLLLLLRQGPMPSASTLRCALSVTASLAGALYFGLPGAAAGSVLASSSTAP
jgi:hypothetical protein